MVRWGCVSEGGFEGGASSGALWYHYFSRTENHFTDLRFKIRLVKIVICNYKMYLNRFGFSTISSL